MSTNFSGRKPDYSVNALNKSNEKRGKVGVAWKQPDGSIRLKLDPFVVLRGSDDLVISLFVDDGRNWSTPVKDEPVAGARKYPKSDQLKATQPDDDDQPF